MEIRAIAPNEWKYTYSQSMQITGQTGNIGHLRGDFDSGGYSKLDEKSGCYRISRIMGKVT